MSGSAGPASKKDRLPYDPNFLPTFAPNSVLTQERSGSKQIKHSGTGGVSGGSSEGGAISKAKKTKKKKKKGKKKKEDDVGREGARVISPPGFTRMAHQ
jgi:hypothetical protein